MRRWVQGCLVSVPLAVLISGPVAGKDMSPLMETDQYQREVAEPLERSFTLTREAIRSMPRQHFDVEILVKQSLDTPEKQFEWVRDHTEWVPYLGILKGDKGVMIDRMGNSLDRVLLLGKMMSLSGHDDWRLRRVALSEEEARKLVDYWAEKGVRHPPVPEPVDVDAAIEKVAKDIQVDPVLLKREMENAFLAFRTEWNELKASSEIQTEVLAEALDIDALFKSEAPEPAQVEVARDHWYLECNLDGKWVKFDPSLRESVMGDVLKVSDRPPLLLGDLEDELFHRLEVRVLAEKWEKGKLSTETAVETAFRVAELHDPHLEIQLSPIGDQPLEKAVQPGEDAQTIMESMLKVDEWLPAISVDREWIYQKSIRKDGTLNETPTATAQVKAMGSAVGALSGLGSGAKVKKVSHLSAVRLELTVQAPSEKPKVFVRYFSDLIGPHLRTTQPTAWVPDKAAEIERALDLSGEISLFVQSFVPTSEWVDFQFFWGWLQNRQALLGVIKGSVLGVPTQVLAGFKELKRTPVDLYKMGGLRFQAQPGGEVTYPASVNLLARWQQLSSPDATGRITVLRVVDWIQNEVEVKPGVETPRKVRFIQGVIDTHVENMKTRDPKGPKVYTLNAAKQFGMDMMEGIDWVAVTDVKQIQNLALNVDTKSRLTGDVKKGYHLLVRSQPVNLGGSDGLPSPLWWRLDPETGSLLGYGLDGRGETVEELAMLDIAFTVAGALVGTAVCVGTKEGLALVCCLAETALYTGLGMGFGQVLGRSAALSAEAISYAGIGFGAASTVFSGMNSLCN